MRRVLVPALPSPGGLRASAIEGRPTLWQATAARWLTWAEYLSSQVPGVVTFAHFLLCDLAPGAVRVSSSKNRGFGESFYCGLQTTGSQDGLATASFAAGCSPSGWRSRRWSCCGRLRLGAGAKAITVDARGPGWWSASSGRRG